MDSAFFSDFFSLDNLVLWGCLAFGVSAGLLSPFVMLRRESFFADVVAHTSIFGIAFMLALAPLFLFILDWCIAYLNSILEMALALDFIHSFYLSVLVFIGALASALLAAWTVALLRRQSRLKNDAILAIVFSSYFALGLMILSRIIHNPFFTYAKSELRAEYSFAALRRYLLGSPASISSAELFLLLLQMIFCILYVLFFQRKLFLLSFDAKLAMLSGLDAQRLALVFNLIICMAVAVSLPFIGLVLVSCMFSAPAIAARVYVHRQIPLLILSTGFSLFAALGGSFIGSKVSRLSEAPATAFIICTLAIFSLLLYKVKQKMWKNPSHL